MSDRPLGSWEESVRWLIAQPDKQILVRDCYYDQPLSQAAERFWKSEEWHAVRELLPKWKGQALDVGAGNGISSYALAKDGWQTTSLEPNPSGLIGAGAIRQLAEQSGLIISVVEEWGERLPFPDDCFELVYGRAVLHHAKNLYAFCREIFRVLKPGGLLVATREHVISNNRQLRVFLRQHPLHALHGDENAFRLAQYRHAITDAGAQLVKVIRPLDSVINYAPHNRATLREELVRRVTRFIGSAPAQLLKNETIYCICLRALAAVDRRPGRAFSFVAQKPYE